MGDKHQRNQDESAYNALLCCLRFIPVRSVRTSCPGATRVKSMPLSPTRKRKCLLLEACISRAEGRRQGGANVLLAGVTLRASSRTQRPSVETKRQSMGCWHVLKGLRSELRVEKPREGLRPRRSVREKQKAEGEVDGKADARFLQAALFRRCDWSNPLHASSRCRPSGTAPCPNHIKGPWT
jgi:hypothetical protein